MLWFHCCLFFIDSRGMWGRPRKKCHYSKLSTFAFYCQLASSVIHNLQILQVSLLPSATLQYLHWDRTRGRVWFAPELKLSQTSLQIQLIRGQIAVLFGLFFSPSPIPSWFEDAPWKNTKPSPYTEVWGPKSCTEAGSEGIVPHRAWQDHLPSASGEIRVRNPGFECSSSVCTWKHTHNENAFHQSSLQQLLKTA